VRRALASLGAVALMLLLALALTRKAPGVPVGPAAPRPSPSAPPVPRPSPAAVDLDRLRDVFQFAGELAPAVVDEPRATAADALQPQAVPTPEPGPKLVGLVWRGSERKAVLALGGSVEVAGPGEQAAGVTIVSVGEDFVRVLRPDGAEEQLELP
jgi:hypothetical protein